VGEAVGDIVGVAVGVAVGDIVGVAVGVAVGDIVGVVVGVLVGDIVGVAGGVPVGEAVGVPVGDLVGIAVGMEVGEDVLGKSASYTLKSGSKTRGVHTPTQQKHWLVTVFQLKRNGTTSPAFSEQYS
jgi:hypothetical protein